MTAQNIPDHCVQEKKILTWILNDLFMSNNIKQMENFMKGLNILFHNFKFMTGNRTQIFDERKNN